MVRIAALYDLSHTLAKGFLSEHTYPWEALFAIKEIIVALGHSLSKNEYDIIGEDVWISKSAQIYPNNYIEGPCIIGHNTEVRPGAFIRGSVLVGENCVVGNSTELKNCILFDNVQVTHYNYVGDSILGYKAHMGAGAVTSNVKSDKTPVVIKGLDGLKIATGRKKVGAMLGDYVEIGCGSVLNPGTIIGRGSSVYPLSSVRGVIPEGSIYKSAGDIVKRI